ncbi:hypothetical protein DAF61_12240, partial [Clostridioides difficile]|nr:hypothetical protein [Clostridioides difficile]
CYLIYIYLFKNYKRTLTFLEVEFTTKDCNIAIESKHYKKHWIQFIGIAFSKCQYHLLYYCKLYRLS